MKLPTQGQVNAATRHLASFAAGAIAVFGLESKVDPSQMTALINGLGALSDDVISIVGIITPMVAALYAARASSPKSQIASVQALPQAQVIVTDPKLASPGVIVDPTAPLTPAQK